MKKINILFVCKYNRFRSQMAEAYFNKINKNKNIKAYSAGIIKGEFVAKNVKVIGKKLGINVSGKPKGVSERLLKQADLIVIVANNVPKSIFFGGIRKVIKWWVPDTSQKNLEGIEIISRNIMKKVDELNQRLR